MNGTSRTSDTAACLGYPCANIDLLHRENKVGYKRSDVYGTLLAEPHTTICKFSPSFVPLTSMDDDLLPAAQPICPRRPERGVTAGKHVMLADIKALEVR